MQCHILQGPEVREMQLGYQWSPLGSLSIPSVISTCDQFHITANNISRLGKCSYLVERTALINTFMLLYPITACQNRHTHTGDVCPAIL